jgi:plastocyanin
VTVTVVSAGFSPAVVTTTVEGNIIWIQNDAKAHTITSGQAGKADGKFESGSLAKGASFTLVLHAAGTYHYFDKNVPSLTGQIVVNPHA